MAIRKRSRFYNIFSACGLLTLTFLIIHHFSDQELKLPLCKQINYGLLDRHQTDCKKLFAQNDAEILKAKTLMKTVPKCTLSGDDYARLTADCDSFKTGRYSFKSSDLERNFPLAFAIAVYKDLEQVERLLRTIYRPENYYCVHVDKKSSDDFKKGIAAIMSCFDNMFLSSSVIEVNWGAYSVLHQNLICMADLWKYKSWKYLINLTGQEFPLKTNVEIVSILKTLKGANVVDGTILRGPGLFNVFSMVKTLAGGFSYRWALAGAPPHNLTLVKGDPEQYPQKAFFLRYKNWTPGYYPMWSRPCGGKITRGVCVLGVGDLHRLKNDISLFANKFFLDYEYLAFDCTEELILNRTREQEKGNYLPDVSFYEALDYNKLMIPVPDQEFYL